MAEDKLPPDDADVWFQRQKKETEPENLRFRLAVGTTHRGKVQTREFTWREFRARCNAPIVDHDYKMSEYVKLSIEEQGERKKLAGYFVGAAFTQSQRKAEFVFSRTLITIDIDDLAAPLFRALMGDGDASGNPLQEYEYVAHTTRKHTPAKPRIRVILPFDCEVRPDQGEAAARIMAQIIDPTMATVDPVSFRVSQFMFWPSVCKDSQSDFRFHHHSGRLVDAELVLFQYDWHLTDKPAPRAPSEIKDHSHVAKKLADPAKKFSIVGAWCRAHTIEELLDGPLSHIYVPAPGEPGRYSHVRASGPSGIVVHDDGHVTSFHSSDPIAGRTVNAWDLMIACQKFRNRDSAEDIEAVAEGRKDSKDLPSYKAMEQFAKEDEKVQLELGSARTDAEALANDAFDAEPLPPVPDLDAAPPPARKIMERAAAPGWTNTLVRDSEGRAICTLYNVATILRNDMRFANVFWFNAMTLTIVRRARLRSRSLNVDSGEPINAETGDEINDGDFAILHSIFSAPAGKGKTGWGMEVPRQTMEMAVRLSAEQLRFHPIQEMVRALIWDGRPRVDTFLQSYFGVSDSALHRQMSRHFLVGLMARAFEPGHKFDFVLTLVGDEGLGKSTAFRLLVGDRYFTELRTGFDDPKRFHEAIGGKWIVEIPELAAFSKAEFEHVKAALSAGGEKYRGPWERASPDRPRQCVFVGTANRSDFLREGKNRRFWILSVPPAPIDTKRLFRERKEILAEAYSVYLAMSLAHDYSTMPFMDLSLQGALHDEAVAIARQHVIDDGSDDDASLIADWLAQPVPESLAEVGSRPELLDPDLQQSTVFRIETCANDIAWFVFHTPPEKVDARLRSRIWAAIPKIPGWRHGLESKKTRALNGGRKGYRPISRLNRDRRQPPE